MLNIVECDSFDDENIFCVYSIIENSNDLGSTSYSTFSYYSFKSITSEKLDKNEFKKNIAGPSLLKIENNNKKQFLICYYENKEKYPKFHLFSPPLPGKYVPPEEYFFPKQEIPPWQTVLTVYTVYIKSIYSLGW